MQDTQIPTPVDPVTQNHGSQVPTENQATQPMNTQPESSMQQPQSSAWSSSQTVNPPDTQANQLGSEHVSNSQASPQFEQPQQPAQQASDQQYQEELDYYQNQEGADYFPSVSKPTIEELVYEWQAPTRPFKQRSKQFYTTIITISVLVSLILFFAGQILPIAVIVAVVFLFYVLSTIPPTQTLVQFTSFGIRFEEQLYFWEELGRFWLETIYDQRVVYIEVSRFPDRLTLLVGSGDEELIIEMLSEVLVMQKPAPTLYEKAAAWLAEKIPLDID